MNDRAHQSIAEAFHQALPLNQIITSPTNPRKRFDQTAMDELIANVKEHGVLTPVMVRPAGEVWELVFGERRYRAALAAGLTTIPATIRALTDVQVIEIQIIENLQRTDVHPIEEAEGYERLMAQTKPDGHTFTADDIAAKVGKSRRYVYNRLQLVKLCPEARGAFFDGAIDIKKAEAISRIGHHDTQRAALKVITNPGYQGETMSSRDTARLITREYMTELEDAPFDIKLAYVDAQGKPIAGACTTCPKRSGNAPDLFEELTGADDTCTDITCFHAKRDAQVRLEEQAFRDQGLIVHTGKEAKTILPSKWNSNEASDAFVAEGQYCYAEGKQYGQIVGKAIQPMMVRHEETNSWVKVYPKAEVNALIEKKSGKKVQGKGDAGMVTPTIKPMQVGYSDMEIAARGYLLMREKLATGLQEDDVRYVIASLITQLYDYQPDLRILGPIYAPELYGDDFDFADIVAKFAATVEKLPNEALPQALMDLTAEFSVDRRTDTASLMAMVKRYGHTEKSITKQLDADKKAREAAKAAAVSPTPPVLPVVDGKKVKKAK